MVLRTKTGRMNGHFFAQIMQNFREAYSLKIISLIISIIFLFTTTLYSYPSQKFSLRIPVGQKDTYERNVEINSMGKIVKIVVSRITSKKLTTFSVVSFITTLILFAIFNDKENIAIAIKPFLPLLAPAIITMGIFVLYEFRAAKLSKLQGEHKEDSKLKKWSRRSFLAASLAVFISNIAGVNLLYIFSRDRSFNRWRYGYPDLENIIRLRSVSSKEAIDKKVRFDEKAEYFRHLKKGPIRPLAIENIEAIKEARAILSFLREYIVDSCNYHNIPTDVLSAFILVNEMIKKYYPTYDLESGLSHVLWHKKKLTNAETEESLEGYMFFGDFSDYNPIVEKLTKLFPNIKLQDRVGDFLGAIANAIPSIGKMQNRINHVIGFGNEINIKEHDLWKRFDIDISGLNNRQISFMVLRDPKLDIEAGAAALRLSVERLIDSQSIGKIDQSPRLPDLSFMKKGDWVYYNNDNNSPLLKLYGPDLIFTMMDRNKAIPKTMPAEMDKDGEIHFLPVPGRLLFDRRLSPEPRAYDFVQDLIVTGIDKADYSLFHIIALESGMFDSIPGIIMGVTTLEKVDYIYKIAEEKDPYLRDAAVRSLKEIAKDSYNIELSRKAKNHLAKLGLGTDIAVTAGAILSSPPHHSLIDRRQFFTLGARSVRQDL
jgi:hypothetical protein